MILNRPAIVFEFDSEGFLQLETSLRLASLQIQDGAGRERRLAHYDSSGFDLAGRGVGLTVADEPQEGRRRQIMACESIRFGRWLAELGAGEGPDRALLAGQCPAAGQSGMTLAPFAVETLAVTGYRAGTGPLAPLVELQSGRIEGSGDRCAVFRAVISGSARSWRRMVKLAEILIEAAPCDLVLSEAEAAMALAQGTRGRAKKARRMGLKGIAANSDAFRLIARLGIEQIAANRTCITTLGNDAVEGVHQMRVGVRRLRSAINLFAPLLKSAPAERVSAHLKSLGALLGPVRDGDVFQEVILDPVIDLLPGHAGLDGLKAVLSQERESLLNRALAALDHQRFTGLMLTLLDWSECGVIAGEDDPITFAASSLDKRHRKLMKAGRDFLNLDPAQRHQLRIRGKKMRYAAEFLQTLFSENKVRRYLEALTVLVDVLGHLNDIAVARRVLEERRQSADDSSLHHGVGFVEGWHAGRAALLEDQAVKAWSDFKRQDKFWK